MGVPTTPVRSATSPLNPEAMEYSPTSSIFSGSAPASPAVTCSSVETSFPDHSDAQNEDIDDLELAKFVVGMIYQYWIALRAIFPVHAIVYDVLSKFEVTDYARYTLDGHAILGELDKLLQHDEHTLEVFMLGCADGIVATVQEAMTEELLLATEYDKPKLGLKGNHWRHHSDVTSWSTLTNFD